MKRNFIFFNLIIFQFLTQALFSTPLWIGKEKLNVEIAADLKSQAKGLMGRTHLSDEEGMLFVYDQPQILSFWMKDTAIPLSIGFFDRSQTLIQIENMNPSSAKFPPTYSSKTPAQYAIEVPQGWFQQHGIKPGMKFSFHDPANRVK